MLGDLLRRLLWVPPLALLVSALIFFLVSREASPTAAAYSHLPRFFNTSPDDAPTLASRALGRLQNGEDPEASASLARLGGAVLPSVLPALEGLPPSARLRVVAALRPVSARMGLSLPQGSPEQEVLWWRHFWEDHALDFHTPTVRRLARRYAANPTQARLLELRHLDTAALPELFAVLGIDGPLPAVTLSQALLPVIQQALGRPATTPEQIHQEVLALRAFWFAHRTEFSTLDGAGRASALLLETQYGKWVERTLLERALRSPRAPVQASSPLRTLIRRGSGTLVRLLLGATLCLTFAWALPRLFGRRLLWKISVISLFALVPAGVLLAPPSEWLGVLLIAAALGPGMLGRAEELLAWAAARPEVPAELARGGHPRGSRGWLALAGRGVVLDLGLATTVVLLLEWRWRLPGLGNLLANALRDQDATLLMSFAVASAVFIQIASAGADVLARWSDPRREGVQ